MIISIVDWIAFVWVVTSSVLMMMAIGLFMIAYWSGFRIMVPWRRGIGTLGFKFGSKLYFDLYRSWPSFKKEGRGLRMFFYVENLKVWADLDSGEFRRLEVYGKLEGKGEVLRTMVVHAVPKQLSPLMEVSDDRR